MEVVTSTPNDSSEITLWGVPTRMVKAGIATCQEYVNPPIAALYDPAQLADCPLWPDPDNFDYTGTKELVNKTRSYNFATIGPWISYFEDAQPRKCTDEHPWQPPISSKPH